MEVALIRVRPGLYRTKECDAIIARSTHPRYRGRLSVTYFDRSQWNCKLTASAKTLAGAVTRIAAWREGGF